LKSNIVKTDKEKVTIAQEETIPNIWNGTMFGDLDSPLNASRRVCQHQLSFFVNFFCWCVCVFVDIVS